MLQYRANRGGGESIFPYPYSHVAECGLGRRILCRTRQRSLQMAPNRFLDVLNRLLHPQARKHPPSANDLEFLERFREIVARHHSDPGFTTAVAAASIGMSRMHLNRKLRALTGESTHEFIRAMRLEAALDLLPKPLPIESIAESVGFRSSSHFAKVFRQRFGTQPSTYRTQKSAGRDSIRPKSPGKRS